MFKSKLALLCLTTLALPLGACSTGSFHGRSSDGMRMTMVWKNPDYGNLTAEEYATVVRHADFCRRMAHEQLSGPVESAVTSGVYYGLGGAAGVGLGALAGDVGSIENMAPYGGVAGAGNGIVSGLNQHSSAVASATGGCVQVNLTDAMTKMPGVHAAPAYVRTRNSSNKLPDWVVPTDSAVMLPTGAEESEDSSLILPPPPR